MVSGGGGGVGCVGGFFRLFHVSTRLHGGRVGGNLDGDYGGKVEEEGKGNYASPPALGVVARLMGLDAMPMPKQAMGTADSWGVRGRSRSMSSVERRRSQVMASEVNCLNKSSSLREQQSFWLSENDGFLVLSFGEDSNKKGEEMKIEACLVASEEEGFGGRRTKIEQKMPEKNRMDSESSSQNSSPVSVLDRASLHSDYEGVGEEDPSERSSGRNGGGAVLVEVEVRRNQPSPAGCWDESCRLALEDVKEMDRWVIREGLKMKYLEDLEIEIEIKILDFLVQEFVEQLYHTFLVKR